MFSHKSIRYQSFVLLIFSGSLSVLLLIILWDADNSRVQKGITKATFEQSLHYNSIDTVLIIEKTLITDSTDQAFYKPCIDWKLSEEEIRKVFALSQPISGPDFHHLYYYLPCEVRGKLKVRSKEYTFTMNAGSFIHLAGPDSSFYMGCALPECEKYFLEKGGGFDESLD